MPAETTRHFSGRTALITGATGGIGREIALAYAVRGGTVALVGRDRGALDEVAGEVSALDVRAEAFAMDLAREEELRVLPGLVYDAFGRLDTLVHAAGLFATGPETPDASDQASQLWQVNAHAPLSLSLSCLAMLREARGEVVFINSSVVRSPAPGLAAYAASKHALAAIADSLRAAVNEQGIRVLSVYPGRTATRMQRRIFELEGRTYRPEQLLQPADVASVVIHALELPQTAKVTDIHIRPFRKPG